MLHLVKPAVCPKDGLQTAIQSCPGILAVALQGPAGPRMVGNTDFDTPDTHRSFPCRAMVGLGHAWILYSRNLPYLENQLLGGWGVLDKNNNFNVTAGVVQP